MQNLRCDWLLSVHYNTTMHAEFFVLSPVLWETSVTKFSVVFVRTQIIIYKCREKQRENEGGKQIGNKNFRGSLKFSAIDISFCKNLAHSSHFTFKTPAIVVYFQKSPVERDLKQLNRQKSPKTCNS